MYALLGFDQYSGSDRQVSVRVEGAHVLLAVQGSDGNGATMLTPAQCEMVAKWLLQQSNETALRYAPEEGA